MSHRATKSAIEQHRSNQIDLSEMPICSPGLIGGGNNRL